LAEKERPANFENYKIYYLDEALNNFYSEVRSEIGKLYKKITPSHM